MPTETIEIFWRDLTREAQARVAAELDENADNIEMERNWDVFPMCEVALDC